MGLEHDFECPSTIDGFSVAKTPTTRQGGNWRKDLFVVAIGLACATTLYLLLQSVEASAASSPAIPNHWSPLKSAPVTDLEFYEPGLEIYALVLFLVAFPFVTGSWVSRRPGRLKLGSVAQHKLLGIPIITGAYSGLPAMLALQVLPSIETWTFGFLPLTIMRLVTCWGLGLLLSVHMRGLVPERRRSSIDIACLGTLPCVGVVSLWQVGLLNSS